MNSYIKISSTGEQLPNEAENWVAVLDPSTNLMWPREESADNFTHADAEKYAASLSLAGFSDWRLPTRKELFGITDDTAFDPAIDTKFFDSHGDAVWTSTTDASDKASFAWAVDFYGGRVHIYYRDYRFRVRAVRSARQ